MDTLTIHSMVWWNTLLNIGGYNTNKKKRTTFPTERVSVIHRGHTLTYSENVNNNIQ